MKDMRHALLVAASLAALPASLALSPAPASAQYAERVLIIYGDDDCPTNTNGEEIVVCSRRPESERYRIPKELRPRSQSPDAQSWAARSAATLDTGAAGAGSCSATGASGWTGCWAEQMRAARAERKADAEAKRSQP